MATPIRQQRKLSGLSNINSFRVLVTFLSLCNILLLLTPTTDAFQLTTAPSAGIGGVQRQQVSSLNYAGTATFSQPPSSEPSSPPPSLRDLLSQTTTTVPSWAAAAAAKREENDLASVIREINTLEDYEKMLQQQQQQAHKQHDAPPLIVVRFHATYCAACKRATPSFHRMVRKFVTLSSSTSTSFPNKKNIQWVDVAVAKNNVDLQKHVGLKSIPSAFLYHAKAGLVEQSSINKSKLSHFEETLETYMEGQCPVNYTADDE